MDLAEWFDNPRWPQLHGEIQTAFDGWLDREDRLANAVDVRRLQERREAGG